MDDTALDQFLGSSSISSVAKNVSLVNTHRQLIF